MIKDSQDGFTADRSCLSNLLYFYDNVIEAVGQDENRDEINLEFGKAFDEVPHQRQIQKVEARGIDG